MSTDAPRVPSMEQSLRVLSQAGVSISTVLDVGVLTGTAPLISAFPSLPHHLFEPVDLHFDLIRKNYANLETKIHHVALSDSDGEAYLARRAIHRDGRITHSEVVSSPVTTEQIPDLVDCLVLQQRRLDSIVDEESISAPYLLKIDVDGHEMPVLRGAETTLKDTAIAVIEAPINRSDISSFFERSEFLRDRGFYLMDIVDLAYYDDILWQVDLIFVRKDIVMNLKKLRPFEAEDFVFRKEHWQPLHR